MNNMGLQKTLKPCGNCRTWRDCHGHWYLRADKTSYEYYHISEIRYCKNQVKWIITEFLRLWADEIIFMRDTWPTLDIETGYTEAPQVKHSISAHAPFEKVLKEVAEVHRRLEKTGSDGRELTLLLENRRDYKDFSQRAKDALSYCSGWRRKYQGYRKWLTQRDRRDQNEAKKASFCIRT